MSRFMAVLTGGLVVVAATLAGRSAADEPAREQAKEQVKEQVKEPVKEPAAPVAMPAPATSAPQPSQPVQAAPAEASPSPPAESQPSTAPAPLFRARADIGKARIVPIPAVIPIVRAPDDPGIDDDAPVDEFTEQVGTPKPKAQAGGWRGFWSRWGG